MTQFIEAERKSYVLHHPALPCLARYHTLNLALGCAYECRYCYAQSFRNHPGPGRVKFYANTPELLRHELASRRTPVELVYISTGCEPFMPHPAMLTAQHECMRLLLVHGARLLITTKSRIPDPFHDLFKKHFSQVHVHFSLTTTDDGIRQAFEPNAATTEERLASIAEMVRLGVKTEARIDPLIPGLTDTRDSMENLCQALSEKGVKSAIASFLFLRRSLIKNMNVRCSGWSFQEMKAKLYTSKIERYCGSGTILIPPPQYRAEKLDELRGIAQRNGIMLLACRCKNPDITRECCHPQS